MAYLPDVRKRWSGWSSGAIDFGFSPSITWTAFWDADGSQMAAAIKRVVGGDAGCRRFLWLVLLAAPFVTFLRELKEMGYSGGSRCV